MNDRPTCGRPHVAVVSALVVIVLSSCGGTEKISETAAETTEPSAATIFRFGQLECDVGLFEQTSMDFSADSVGFDTPEAALEDWTTGSDYQLNPHWSELVPAELEVSSPGASFALRDSAGWTRLVVRVGDAPAGGHRVGAYNACAPPGVYEETLP
jgi:hypothetical protein